MLKYLWIVCLVIPYILWSTYSFNEIWKAYKENKECFDLLIDTNELVTLWGGITIVIMLAFGIASAIVCAFS